MDELKHLGKQSQEPIEKLDLIPWGGNAITVRIDCAEFTSLCPVTRQPDYARLAIVYVPAASLVETKSLKLWLWGWRNRAQFNERLVDELARSFFEQVQPRTVTVEGTFNARGGISVSAISTRSEEP